MTPQDWRSMYTQHEHFIYFCGEPAKWSPSHMHMVLYKNDIREIVMYVSFSIQIFDTEEELSC